MNFIGFAMLAFIVWAATIAIGLRGSSHGRHRRSVEGALSVSELCARVANETERELRYGRHALRVIPNPPGVLPTVSLAS
jgi:hypothetical protein